ncbi:Peptidase S28 family-containing protein [Aphelenchoides fujianensis]|nr:Peptidase S28 family-containing protein [Aphelenchoides fujianensis]
MRTKSERSPPPHSTQWTVRPAICLLLCTLAATFCTTSSGAEAQRKIPRIFMGKFVGTTRRDLQFDRMLNIRRSAGDLPKNESVCDNDQSPVEVAYWLQKLDNFDANNNATWKQHYQVQRKYFKADGDQQVIFVQIGGEGPISNKWVCYDNYTYMQAAKNYSALVIQVEHRFFGHNQGTDQLTNENLKYLTTEQALADLTSFITGFVQQEKYANPKVVAFGGSYPGTIAALHRLVYPNVTQGNVASSAPLYAKLDFWEYAQVMEQTIKATGELCYNNTRDAFAALVTATLTKEGRANLKKIFSLKPGLTEPPKKEDIDTVTSTVFAAFQGIIQYTYDGVEQFENKTGVRETISYACGIMNNGSLDLLERLHQVYVLANGDDAFVSDYWQSIAPFFNLTSGSGGGADMRGWMWLSCNEFGWLQSTSNNGLFGDVVPISLYIKQCEDLFNQTLTPDIMKQRIQATLQRYGYPEDFNATNVFLPNGGFDPWHALGVSTNKSNAQHVIPRLTPEAAHCSDMYGYYEGEPAGLNETRKMFFDEVNYYLSLPSSFKATKGVGTAVLSLSTFLFSLLFPIYFH